jgi:hypothetical protein
MSQYRGDWVWSFVKFAQILINHNYRGTPIDRNASATNLLWSQGTKKCADNSLGGGTEPVTGSLGSGKSTIAARVEHQCQSLLRM